MARQTTHTHQELQSIKLMGGQYLVVAVGDIGPHAQGDAISWHRTYDTAARKAGASTWFAILSITDALDEARIEEMAGY